LFVEVRRYGTWAGFSRQFQFAVARREPPLVDTERYHGITTKDAASSLLDRVEEPTGGLCSTVAATIACSR